MYIDDAQGDPNAILRSLSPDFCYYAVKAKRGTPLAAAAASCRQYEEQTKAVYNNLSVSRDALGRDNREAVGVADLTSHLVQS